MFDLTLNLLLCMAPLLAIVFGYLAYKYGPSMSMDIEEKTGQNHPWMRLLFNFSFLLIVPLGCYYSMLTFDLWEEVMWRSIAKGIGILAAATGVISLRSSLFPSWFGWVSLFTAIGLLTPIAWLFLPYAFVWLVVVSIWLYHRRA